MPILVGRRAEVQALERALDDVQALERALDDVQAGSGSCVVITGEAGIGKSRLVRELLRLASERGLAAVAGRAVPASANAPYRPITEELLALLRDRPVPPDPALVRWLPHLRAIAPAALPPSVDAPTPDAASSAAVRGEAVLQLLSRIAPEGLVLALEDLHWADPDTVAVVEYLADHAASQALLLAVTVRNEPSAALDLVRRQRGRPAIAQLPLERLTAAEVARMIAACDPDTEPAVQARVTAAAEGVPLLVEDLLASPGIPESITETVAKRLAGFPAGERTVIEAAAVLGRHFDWEILPKASGRSADETAAALARAVDCRLLVTTGAGFQFRHALTRDAVLGAMFPPQLRATAARVLTGVSAAHPDLAGGWRDIAAEVAELAGESERAGRLLLDSGRESLAIGALATAVDTLRRAAALLPSSQERISAQRALVEALATAGRVDDAVAAGHRLLAELGSEPGVVAAARTMVPDIVIFDSCAYAGPLAAAICGLPAVCLQVGFPTSNDVVELVADALSPMWCDAGQPVDRRRAVYGDFLLDTVPPSIGRREPPISSLALRPTPAPAMPSMATSPPLVHVSFGTAPHHDLGALRCAVEALADEPVRVLATIGNDDELPWPADSVPSNASLQRYVSHAELLPRCSVIIHHGGAGTMYASLVHGLPQVIVPTGADQFANAATMRAAGLALTLDAQALTPEAVRAAVRTALREEAMRRRAANLAGEILAMPAADAVADQLRARFDPARADVVVSG